MAANVKYHSLQLESGRSVLLLDIGFTTHGLPDEQPRGRRVWPRVDGRCDPQRGGPGKNLKRKDVRGRHVSKTPHFVGTFPF